MGAIIWVYCFCHTGVPSIPHPRVTIVNKTTLQISWARPFTMGHFTVHNYSLTVVNTTSDSVIESRNILARNATVYTELFSTPNAAQTCSQLQISLTAANVIGESGVGTTTGGFPVSKFPYNSWTQICTCNLRGFITLSYNWLVPIDIRLAITPKCYSYVHSYDNTLITFNWLTLKIPTGIGPGPLESLESEITFQSDGPPQVEIQFIVRTV